MTCIHAGNAIVTLTDEVERPPGADLRTRAGREAEVLEQVRQFGGFSVFWATDNLLRAYAIDRLVERGELAPTEPAGQFPWNAYRVVSGGGR